MAPPQDAKVENAVKFGVVRLHGQQNKPIQTKFGMQVYIGSLLQCGKLGHDRFRGWIPEPHNNNNNNNDRLTSFDPGQPG